MEQLYKRERGEKGKQTRGSYLYEPGESGRGKRNKMQKADDKMAVSICERHFIIRFHCTRDWCK